MLNLEERKINEEGDNFVSNDKNEESSQVEKNSSFNQLELLQVSLKTNINDLKESISSIALKVDIKEIEQASSVFIKDKLTKSGLLETIEKNSKEASELLEEINFFGNNKTSTAVNSIIGFFSHQFSSEDEAKWEKIERLLSDIYDANVGIIKRVQDYFLFQIDREQISKFLNKTNISFEEDLFIRSVLIKGYLNNFRQLILPFHEISDDVLISFKKERIKHLEENQDANNQAEIKLLTQQVEKLELQVISEAEKRQETERKIKINSDNITAYNTQLNTGSIFLGSVETTRYFTSFLGHKFGSETLKKVGDLGLGMFDKAGVLLGKFLPVVSVLVEAGTQVNNNRIVYNYEKKLKLLQLVDNTKRNLIILEQQVTDYYLDTVLNRLQEMFLNNQVKTQEIVTQYWEQQVILQRDLQLIGSNLTRNIINLKKENQSKDKIIEELTEKEEKLRIELSSILFFANHSKRKEKELENKVAELNKILEEKDNQLGTLTEKLDAKALLKEKEKKELERELFFKLQNSTANKSQVIDNLQKEIMENEAYQNNLEQEKLHLKSELRNLQSELENVKRLKDTAELFLNNARNDNQIIIGQVINYKQTEESLNARIKELEKENSEWIQANQEVDAINLDFTLKKQQLEREKRDLEKLIAIKEAERKNALLEKEKLLTEKEKLISQLEENIINLEQSEKSLREQINHWETENKSLRTALTKEIRGRKAALVLSTFQGLVKFLPVSQEGKATINSTIQTYSSISLVKDVTSWTYEGGFMLLGIGLWYSFCWLKRKFFSENDLHIKKRKN